MTRMSSTLSLRSEQQASFAPLILASLVFHVLVLLVIPLLTRLIWRPERFERPRTFRLVTMPKVKKVAPPDVPVVKKRVEKKRKVPSKTASKPAPKKEPEEDLSQLEDLLGAIQEPAVDLSLGADVVEWYKASILSKIERNWRPPFENPDIFVKVTFTIFLNGGISEVRLVRSSGNGSVDNTALRAVKLSAPFGKLPPNYSGNSLEVNLLLRPTRR
jgi:TonB family protein